MKKKYVVRLTDEERAQCKEVIARLAGSSQKARRARILLQVDQEGPGWQDKLVAEAYKCRVETVENVRKRCVLEGFKCALEGRWQEGSRPPRVLDGKQEAEVIALRLGPPPEGYGSWSLRLLARRVVELGIVESISHETVNRTLKKTGFAVRSCSIG